ncbi:MAG: UvrB/UvrC motif-containing protein [Oscillospiraceae bacterium]|nr:UvrB/UvrC motif-containing protein [Oscillospiraceae bacterium]
MYGRRLKAEGGGQKTDVGNVEANIVHPKPYKNQKSTGGEHNTTNSIDDLKQKLKEAIRTENYEEAARLRDKIKGIE